MKKCNDCMPHWSCDEDKKCEAKTQRLIDANALIRDGWVLERHGVSNSLLEVKSIADVPTIEAEPVRHGRWKKTYTCHGEWAWGFECNQCKADNPRESHFCPNCGAKMDLEGE